MTEYVYSSGNQPHDPERLWQKYKGDLPTREEKDARAAAGWCTARSKNKPGLFCGQKIHPGERVCRWHGGLSPSTMEKVAERLAKLVDPSLEVFYSILAGDAGAVPADQIRVARDVLDRAGYVAVRRLEVKSETRSLLDAEIEELVEKMRETRSADPAEADAEAPVDPA